MTVFVKPKRAHCLQVALLAPSVCVSFFVVASAAISLLLLLLCWSQRSVPVLAWHTCTFEKLIVLLRVALVTTKFLCCLCPPGSIAMSTYLTESKPEASQHDPMIVVIVRTSTARISLADIFRPRVHWEKGVVRIRKFVRRRCLWLMT